MTPSDVLQRAKDLSDRLREESRQVRSGLRNRYYGDHSDGAITIAQVIDDLRSQLRAALPVVEAAERWFELGAPACSGTVEGYCLYTTVKAYRAYQSPSPRTGPV